MTWARDRGRVAGLLVCLTVIGALALPAGAGAFVYWANLGSDQIGRANLDGSDPDQTFIGTGTLPCGVAVDGSHIFWADEGFRGSGDIARANLDGSDVTGIADSTGGAPCGVAVGGGHVYWANRITSTIGRAGLDGSDADPSFIPIPTGLSPCGVATDHGFVYWTIDSNLAPDAPGAIARAQLGGTYVQGLIGGDSGAAVTSLCGVAVDAGHIYWTNQGPGTIGRANLDGSDPDQDFITGASSPCGVAVDGGHVYWANSTASSIGRANLDGSDPDQDFITGASSPCGVAVDGADRWGLDVATAGSGTVTGAGISCPGACSEVLGNGTPVTLTASPAAGSTFAGWSGACSGTGPCSLTMDTNKSVTATFAANAPSPPGTRISKRMIKTRKRVARFWFEKSGAATGFRCRLRRTRHPAPDFRRCTSPKRYRNLKRGQYVFAVRAVGPGGSDPSAAKRTFEITGKR